MSVRRVFALSLFRKKREWLWCALLFSLPLAAGEPPTPAPAPAVNWVLPLFSDKEGYRSMTLRGSEVRPAGKTVAVTDLSITIFSGDAEAKVDSILLSREARFFPKEQRAAGDADVRFIRGDIEVTGNGWTYDHASKKVSLQRNVRVTFSAQLNDILK
ncbi:MAG: LPS export ABC transporter periplasmic protein LptC [Verrucomicrobiota bacterium]